MGAGLGMLGAVGGMMQNMTSPYMNGMGAMTGIPQPMAGQTMAGMQKGAGQMAAMPDGSGTAPQQTEPNAAPVPAADPVEVLGKLKRLLDAGLIEQEEYDAKKREILANL